LFSDELTTENCGKEDCDNAENLPRATKVKKSGQNAESGQKVVGQKGGPKRHGFQ